MLTKMGVVKTVKVITVDEAVLQAYDGVYELAPGFVIAVTHEGTRLFGQATGQERFEMFAKSPTEFYLKIVDAQIVFTVNGGKAESLTLYQEGQVLPGKRVK
ncbi:MAG: DUF3471 domain-containing protein [Saprospiraceae bacterium]|nr:DUF3471 domain-containing protein [Saprospiraceae bacterium]